MNEVIDKYKEILDNNNILSINTEDKSVCMVCNDENYNLEYDCVSEGVLYSPNDSEKPGIGLGYISQELINKYGDKTDSKSDDSKNTNNNQNKSKDDTKSEDDENKISCEPVSYIKSIQDPSLYIIKMPTISFYVCRTKSSENTNLKFDITD